MHNHGFICPLLQIEYSTAYEKKQEEMRKFFGFAKSFLHREKGKKHSKLTAVRDMLRMKTKEWSS